MRRPVVLSIALALLLALLAVGGSMSARGGSQESTPIPTSEDPTDELPQYLAPNEYDDAGAGGRDVMIVRLGATELAGARAGEQLVQSHIRLGDRGDSGDPVEHADAEILTVHTGAVVFRFAGGQDQTRLIRGPIGDRCALDSTETCLVVDELDANDEIRLEPGDGLSHSEPATYAYRLADGSSAGSRMAPAFGAASLPAAGCSGGCRRLIIVSCLGPTC